MPIKENIINTNSKELPINLTKKIFETNLNENTYSITNRKSYSIKEVAKLFKSKIKFLPSRLGERYASALTDMNLSNKVHRKFGKIKLKDYIDDFINKFNNC